MQTSVLCLFIRWFSVKICKASTPSQFHIKLRPKKYLCIVHIIGAYLSIFTCRAKPRQARAPRNCQINITDSTRDEWQPRNSKCRWASEEEGYKGCYRSRAELAGWREACGTRGIIMHYTLKIKAIPCNKWRKKISTRISARRNVTIIFLLVCTCPLCNLLLWHIWA